MLVSNPAPKPWGLIEKILSMPAPALGPASTMVVAEFAPTILTPSVISKSPVVASWGSAPAAGAIVSWYVPAGTIMVSEPALALASRMASRKLQVLGFPGAQPLAVTVSAVVLTVNVGSGKGIITRGATWLWWSRITPGRPSTLTRADKAVTGDPL